MNHQDIKAAALIGFMCGILVSLVAVIYWVVSS
jgi:hypothetical protein